MYTQELGEMNFSVAEDKETSLYFQEMIKSDLDARQFKFQGGESREDLVARAANFVDKEIVTKFGENNFLIVIHGMLMKELLHPIKTILNPEYKPDMSLLENTCIYKFKIEKTEENVKWIITTRGDHEHIKILENERFGEEDRKTILDFEDKF